MSKQQTEMKKIMFNDRYGLTKAVLDGRKTMTRRIATELNHPNITDISEWGVDNNGKAMLLITYDTGLKKDVYPHFQIGEEVAVAQTYKDSGWNPDVLQETFVRKPTVFPDLDPIETHLGWVDLPFKYHKGWTNKMFVLADLMPHRIRITDIKVERLQDISVKDCMKEGITTITEGKNEVGNAYGWDVKIDAIERDSFFTPRAAFAALIDRISGRGTWERNPWVYAYEFELIK